MEQPSNEVENVPPVVARVQELFDYYGLNASSATKALGYNTTSKLYKILQGSEPSLPTLVDFLKKWPAVSPEWLVLGEGPMLRAGAAATPAGPAVAAAGRAPVVNSGQVVAITVDKDGDDNTELVPINAQAGYALQHNEAVFVQDLPRYRLPPLRTGEVSGVRGGGRLHGAPH